MSVDNLEDTVDKNKNLIFSFSDESEESEEEDDGYFISDEEEVESSSSKDDVYIKDDFESVVTLSNSSDIVLNKKIQQIKQTIDTLLSTCFTLEENIKIHSIYNFNLSCLQNRNRFLQEFVLIIVFLEYMGMCFSKTTLSLVFPKMLIVPKKKNFERIKNYIISKFIFTDFILNETLINNNENSLLQKIEKYSASILFFIKNRLLLYKESEFSKEEQNELCDLLMKNKNNTFVSDPKLQAIISWLSYLVKNLILYNIYNIHDKKNKYYYFNKKKTIEYHISLSLRIIICFMSSIDVIDNETKYINLFLLYRDENNLIKPLLENRMFQSILKEIIIKFKKEETLKIFKKEFVAHVKNVLEINGSIE